MTLEIKFDAVDCALFRKYPRSVSFNDVSPQDKDHYRSIRNRLKSLVSEIAEREGQDLKLQPHASIFNPNGRSASDLWACLYPASEPNKSFSLQVAVIISQNGCELCFCLGAGTAQVRDPQEIQKNKNALERTKAKLKLLPPSETASLQARLQGKWQYRKQWRQAPESTDFSSMDEWLSYASSNGGDGASVSRNLSPSELESIGPDFSKVFEEAVDLFNPLLSFVYSDQISNAPDSNPLQIAMPKPNLNFDFSEASADLVKAISGAGFNFEPWQIACYLTALRTKPFVILGGVSGTGKSQLPALVASKTGGVSELVPVRPDWTDSSEVLGYVDLQGSLRPGPVLRLAKSALQDPERYHVCIIDEMNLARVEYYFAEILSRIEQSRGAGSVPADLISYNLLPTDDEWRGIGFPANFAIVGTVNMDESTHGFSKKVIDRAFTLEFSDVDLSIWETDRNLLSATRDWSISAWSPRAVSPGAIQGMSTAERNCVIEAIDRLIPLNSILKQAQLQLGYRSRDEIAMFVLHARDIEDLFYSSQQDVVDPLDLAIQMKVLPRIAGGSGAIRRLILSLLGWANNGSNFESESDAQKVLTAWQELQRPAFLSDAKLPRTAARLCLMWERISNEGFTSYWV